MSAVNSPRNKLRRENGNLIHNSMKRENKIKVCEKASWKPTTMEAS